MNNIQTNILKIMKLFRKLVETLVDKRGTYPTLRSKVSNNIYVFIEQMKIIAVDQFLVKEKVCSVT